MSFKPTLFVCSLFVSQFFLSACSDVDEQTDAAPKAVATVIGASSMSRNIEMRSGSDVLVSGKDSDGIDDPIMEFDIRVVRVTGDENVTVESANQSLSERSASTKVYRSPSVVEDTEVIFEVEVTDADGETDSDTVAVTILSVGDSNTFLTQASVANKRDNQYALLVALDLQVGEETNSNFELAIDTIVEWKPSAPHEDCIYGASSDMCRWVSGTETITGTWESGIDKAQVDAVDPEDAAFNPRYWIETPAIDVDAINRQFEDSDREKRLELADVASARTYHRYRFVSTDNNAQLLILDEDEEDSGLLDHRYVDVGTGDSTLIESQEIRALNATENFYSAEAYYRIIDPLSRADTLDKWKALRGFDDSVSEEYEFAHALYLNNYDLGFGRDMFMRTDECGNVYSYVENYPSLELAIKGQGNFATVVMEYAPLNDDDPEACSSDTKFVKFYAYVPDEKSGEEVRMPTMNFDGRGEKSLPGVCTACHAGSPAALVDAVSDHVALNGTDLNVIYDAMDALTDEQKLALVDLDATFMPFDLDSFLFTESGDSNFRDPFYSTDEISASQVRAYSREAQLAAFNTMNKAALRTYLHKSQSLVDDDPLDDIDPTDRWIAPIELVNAWYGTSIEVLADLDDLDGQDFSGDAILDGWFTEQAIYEDVFARYCRACHIQLANTSLNFDLSDEFFDVSDPDSTRLEDVVFGRGAMPLARLTMDRFWVDFYNGSSAAETLQQHLAVTTVPGALQAAFDISEAFPDGIGESVTLNADAVLGEVDEYAWTITNNCSGENPYINGSNTAQASFVTANSPCTYYALLTVSNAYGEDSLEQEIVVDRAPEVVSPAIEVTESLASYTPGDHTLVIDVDALVTGRGDNGGPDVDDLQVIVDDADLLSSVNGLVSSNGDGSVSYVFSPLDGVNDSFNYRLRDTNDTISQTEGAVNINLPAIVPVISNDTSGSASSIDLQWEIAYEFSATDYRIFRTQGVTETELDLTWSCNDDADNQETNCSATDNGVSPGNQYAYQISAVLGVNESSRSEVFNVSTSTTVPVISSVVPVSVEDCDENFCLEINWSIVGDPNHFRVFRNSVELPIFEPTGSEPFVDKNLEPNTEYTYEFIAVFDTGDSAPSTPSSEFTYPAQPLLLTAYDETSSRIDLSWNANDNPNDTTYYLCHSGTVNCKSAGTDLTEFRSGLSPNTNYTFYVYADWKGDAMSTYVDGVDALSDPEIHETLVSFSSNIEPLFDAIEGSCTGCHGTSGGFTITNDLYTELNETSVVNGSLKRRDTARACVRDGCGSMGAQSAGFDNDDLIGKWISQGALNN